MCVCFVSITIKMKFNSQNILSNNNYPVLFQKFRQIIEIDFNGISTCLGLFYV